MPCSQEYWHVVKTEPIWPTLRTWSYYITRDLENTGKTLLILWVLKSRTETTWKYTNTQTYTYTGTEAVTLFHASPLILLRWYFHSFWSYTIRYFSLPAISAIQHQILMDVFLPVWQFALRMGEPGAYLWKKHSSCSKSVANFPTCLRCTNVGILHTDFSIHCSVLLSFQL